MFKFNKKNKLSFLVRKNSHSDDGFSLIEILVVVAIIGIIVSIAVPALSTAKRESQNSALNGSLKTLNEAVIRDILKSSVPNNGSVPVSMGFDVDGDSVLAISYYLSNGYISDQSGVIGLSNNPIAVRFIPSTNSQGTVFGKWVPYSMVP